MVADVPVSNASPRTLRTDDLERVIAIDQAQIGRARRRFFVKRFRAAEQHPDDFIHLGVDGASGLIGFVLARVMHGEFGRDQPVAALDVLDVDPGSRERGCGRKLLDSLAHQLRHKGVTRLYSEAEWTNHGLLKFFDASGFKLARRVVLERRVAEPFAEVADGV